MKGLTWDKNGYCIYYKRLDGVGARFSWPRNADGVRNINETQLKHLLGGFSLDPPRGFGEVTARDY